MRPSILEVLASLYEGQAVTVVICVTPRQLGPYDFGSMPGGFAFERPASQPSIATVSSL